MQLDVYLKTVLTVIAVALVAIAVHLWAERVSPSVAQAQTTKSGTAMDASPSLEPIATRVSAIERTQKEQAQRLETLRAALQSTVLGATRRGYFPDGTWSTIHWDPDVPPASGG
jgi:hypothetical protein